MNRFLFVAVVLFLSACTAVIGEGPELERTMTVSDFEAVRAGHSFHVYVHLAPQCRVVVRAASNIWPFVQVKAAGGLLSIGLQPGRTYVDPRCSADVYLPRLKELDLGGAASARLRDEFLGSSLVLRLSGASHMQGKMQVGKMFVNLSGASRATLTGKADSGRLHLSGASRANLERFPLQNLDAQLSGASRARVDVRGRLDVHLSGASRLRYRGAPRLGKVHTSGASGLSRMD